MTIGEAVLLVGGAAVAGVVNTLAGGASALTVPLLVLVGLPGTVANGTNRVGILTQNAVAAWRFRAEGVSGFGAAVPVLLPVALGAAVGAAGISQVADETFQRAFGVVMIALLVPIALGVGSDGAVTSRARRLSGPGTFLIFFAIGLYGGAFQAGVGILLIYGISWSGVDLIRTNSMKVVINFCFTLLVLPIFLLSGQIAWAPALVLGAGFAAGGWIGPRLAVRGGERVIRPVLGVAVVALAGRMLGLY